MKALTNPRCDRAAPEEATVSAPMALMLPRYDQAQPAQVPVAILIPIES